MLVERCGSASSADPRTTMPPGGVTVLATLIAAAFIMVLNETIMTTALPHLMVDFAVGASVAQWLTTGFILVMAIVTPTTGYLMQRFATRTVFLAAIGAFAGGTLIAASAPGFAVLLAARFIQALGTAVMLPLLTTAVMQLVPTDRRGTYIGLVVVVMATAPALGPPLSGIIVALLGWRGIFLSLLPVALIVLLFGAFRLQNLNVPAAASLDGASVVLAALAFGSLIYAISALGEGGALIPGVLVFLIGAGALAAFVRRQRHRQRIGIAPLLDLTPFANRQFASGMVVVATVVLCQAGAMSALPLYTQGVQRLSTSTSGLLMMPGGLVVAALALPAGRLYDRLGPRPLVIPGALLLTGSMLLLTIALGRSPSPAVLAVIYGGLNVAVALTMAPVITAALASLRPDQYGYGSAIVSTLQPFSAALAVAMFVGIMARASAHPGVADVASTRLAFLAGTLISVAGIIGSLRTRRP